ncbi:MAG: hypothetical protein O7D35_04990 [Acidobacteria bacterium]|nr:hypothetical protein [Acidobacteriota bacterium]
MTEPAIPRNQQLPVPAVSSTHDGPSASSDHAALHATDSPIEPAGSASAKSPAAIVCPLTETQARVESSLDELIANLPEDPEAATAHTAVALELRPQPELLRALHLLARPGTAQPLRGELLRKLVLLSLLVDKHLRELTRSSCIEPHSLGVASRSITTLIELVSALRQEFGTRILELHHHDSQQFNGLLRALMPATDRLHSYGLLISMLEPLAREAAAGRADKIVYLQRHEADLFTSALNRDHETGPAGRVILDTVALRCGLQEALEEWNELAQSAPAHPDSPHQQDSKRESRRQEMLARLRVGMSIYNVLLERIQYQQSATLSQGDKASFDHISSAQRLLFAVYSQIVGVVRNPDPINQQREDEVDSALQDFFTEAAAAEENASESQTEEEVYLEALTRMRDEEQGHAQVTMTTGIDPRKQRRRRQILLAATAFLAVIAVGVNIALWKTGSHAHEPILDEFAAAMPLDTAARMGPAMYAEIPAFNWNAMDLEERTRRVDLLGELAAARGFHAVILVDESRTDLAHWSREDGAVLTPAGSALPD